MDPATLSAVTFVLLAVGLAACYFPARRAMRINPILALRTE
jgi:ABC-type antimicrobial peptide transport system permease subunit